MKLTSREADEILEAIETVKKTIEQMTGLEHAARMGYEIDDAAVWELRNQAQRIAAVLYNVHHGVYREAVRS